ncbi:unnamed protein product, partial [Iphiclides podalirius]
MQKVKSAVNFFGDGSSLHGVGHVVSASQISRFKRVFWITILAISSFGALTMLRSSLNLYTEAAVSFSVETNYLDWDTPFPALSVCESAGAERVKAYLTAFIPTETEYGVCYSFNSGLAGNTSNILTVNRKVGLPSLVFTAMEAIWAEQTVSDVSVSTLQPEIRHCLYGHERPDFADKWPFKKYSYGACILYCRAMSQFDYCNCTHHLMPHIGQFA